VAPVAVITAEVRALLEPDDDAKAPLGGAADLRPDGNALDLEELLDAADAGHALAAHHLDEEPALAELVGEDAAYGRGVLPVDLAADGGAEPAQGHVALLERHLDLEGELLGGGHDGRFAHAGRSRRPGHPGHTDEQQPDEHPHPADRSPGTDAHGHARRHEKTGRGRPRPARGPLVGDCPRVRRPS
jgi:hypothetical protein